MTDQNTYLRIRALLAERFEVLPPDSPEHAAKLARSPFVPPGTDADVRFFRRSDARRDELDAELDRLILLLPESERKATMDAAIAEVIPEMERTFFRPPTN